MASIAQSLHIRGLSGRNTLAQGQCCDLKIETNTERHWLCRLPRSEHRITVEKWNPATNAWETSEVYEDKKEE